METHFFSLLHHFLPFLANTNKILKRNLSIQSKSVEKTFIAFALWES